MPAVCSLHLPSNLAIRGLGSALARMLSASRAFSEFDWLHLWGFPRRAQIASSPLCLPISPLGLVWLVAEPIYSLATLGLLQLYPYLGSYMTPSSQRAVGDICTKARGTSAISSSAPIFPMRKRLDKRDFKSLVSTSFTTRARQPSLQDLREEDGGACRSRTDLHGFAIRCITALLSRRAYLTIGTA